MRFRQKPHDIEAVQVPSLSYDEHPLDFAEKPYWFLKALTDSRIRATWIGPKFWHYIVVPEEGSTYSVTCGAGDWITFDDGRLGTFSDEKLKLTYNKRRN